MIIIYAWLLVALLAVPHYTMDFRANFPSQDKLWQQLLAGVLAALCWPFFLASRLLR